MRLVNTAPRVLAAAAACFSSALMMLTASASAARATIPHGTVDLVAENQSIAPGKTTYLGLRFQLEKGWHIYWVNPGDSGEPPKVTWQLPPGVTAGAIEWPTPHRLGTSSIVDFGYDGDVMLLVPLRASANLAARSAQIAGEVKVLICREMCIPGKANVSISLPVQSQSVPADAQTRQLFEATRKLFPKPAPSSWKFSASDANDSFVLTASVGRQVAQATFFPKDESQIDNAAPQQISATASGFSMTLRKSAQLLKPIQRLRGVVVLAEGQSYIIDAPVSRAGAKIQRNDFGFQADKSFKEVELR
jgi:DsbC/DsbD-like thiol-disulfide interchange protein